MKILNGVNQSKEENMLMQELNVREISEVSGGMDPNVVIYTLPVIVFSNGVGIYPTILD